MLQRQTTIRDSGPPYWPALGAKIRSPSLKPIRAPLGRAALLKPRLESGVSAVRYDYPPPVLARRIIPCLDVKDGRVVKGVRFVNLTDEGDPVESAVAYDAEEADELCLLDITATWEERGTALRTVHEVAEALTIPFTVGGGVRTVRDMDRLLRAGADKGSVDSAAVRRPGGFEVFTAGGRRPTGLDAIEWIQRGEELGAGEILLTSMDRDGTGDGYDLDQVGRAAEAVRIPVIASGGVGDLSHIAEVFERTGASAALAATIFHRRIHTIPEAKRHLAARGIPVRPPEPELAPCAA